MLETIQSVAIKVLGFFFESRAKFILLLVLLVAPILMLTKIVTTPNNPSSFTVMVTRMDEQSGGSGSVIFTSTSKSIVLTNSHVCNVLNKTGGVVKKEDGTKFMISGYHKSEFHDLCAVYVAADLGVKVDLAKEAPVRFSEATITGHPALLPNVINKGNFGERKIIEIMTGIRPCDEKDIKSEQDALYCFVLGGIPIITSYESIVVSALIMGGSSGSAVLNDKGELAGVVFAGQSGGLSYAFIVPYEYVAIFIKEELTVPFKITKVPFQTQEEESHEQVQEAKQKLKEECGKDNKKIKSLCEIVKQDLANN